MGAASLPMLFPFLNEEDFRDSSFLVMLVAVSVVLGPIGFVVTCRDLWRNR